MLYFALDRTPVLAYISEFMIEIGSAEKTPGTGKYSVIQVKYRYQTLLADHQKATCTLTRRT